MTKNITSQYHQRIAQLVLREKAALINNQTLTAQQHELTKQLNNANRQNHTASEQNHLFQEEIDKLQMEMRISTNARLQLQEENDVLKAKVFEASSEIKSLRIKQEQSQSEISRLKGEVQQRNAENTRNKSSIVDLEKMVEDYEQSLRMLKQKGVKEEGQAQQLRLELQSSIKTTELVQRSKRQLKIQLEQMAKKSAIELQTIRIKLSNKEGENMKISSELKDQERQNKMMKQKSTKHQQEIWHLQSTKNQLELSYKKMEKDTRKTKDQLTQAEIKIKDLQEQLSSFSDKYRSLEKKFKSSKKQADELRQIIQNTKESSESENNRVKRLEVINKTFRDRTAELEENLSTITQKNKQFQHDLSLTQKSKLEMQFQVDRMTKENNYLKEQCQQQQEKRIIGENEKEKMISSLVRDKDILNRANFKILQILQAKDSVINAIIQGLQSGTMPVDFKSHLKSKSFLQQMSVQESRLRDGRERVKYLQQWLKSTK